MTPSRFTVFERLRPIRRWTPRGYPMLLLEVQYGRWVKEVVALQALDAQLMARQFDAVSVRIRGDN